MTSQSTSSQHESVSTRTPPGGMTTLFGPSVKTLNAVKKRMPAVIREALPFGGVSIAADITFNTDTMQSTLDGSHIELRKEAMEFLAHNPVFMSKHSIGESVASEREKTLQQMIAYAKAPFYRFQDIYEDPLRWMTCLEVLYYHSITLGTKFGVHFGLFGGTMMNIGSDRQRKLYAEDIHSMKMNGAFGLTELGHGSDARSIETVATYDSATQEFVLNTPTEMAQKIYIGNLACNANHAAVFAQLYVDDKHYGVHVFLVRIRDDNDSLCDGVRIIDCGVKSGLNGVDNGRLWLDDKRIPRHNLLDRFGSVNDDGVYSSATQSNSKRFTIMVGSLVGGRVGVAQGGLNIAKIGLTVAIRYALTRKQFTPPDSNRDWVLADYLSHQRRLFPLLAKTYALQLTMNSLKKMFAQQKGDAKHMHILAAALKPACTWHRAATLLACREACGGIGFMAANRIGPMMNDSDIDKTWEGDNTVLLQQVASSLLKNVRQKGTAGYLSLLVPAFDPNPLTTSNLRDFDFFIHAMRFREARILRALVHKLQRHSHLTSFEAWNKCLDIANELAKAFTDRQVIEQFADVIAQCESNVKPMLHAIGALHALWTLQENIGFFMTMKYMSALKAKAIWTEVNKLLEVLRPHIRQLVDAFGIPENLIDAPIAGNWLEAYSYPNVPGGHVSKL